MAPLNNTTNLSIKNDSKPFEEKGEVKQTKGEIDLDEEPKEPIKETPSLPIDDQHPLNIEKSLLSQDNMR